MCKLSLNQNLTLSYDNTSYSGQQDINSTLQAILEKVFPNLIDFNIKPSTYFSSSAYIISYAPIKSYYGGNTTDVGILETPFIDMTSHNIVELGSINNISGQVHNLRLIAIAQDNTQVQLLNKDYTTTESENFADVSSLSGLYKLRLEVRRVTTGGTGWNVNITKYTLE